MNQAELIRKYRSLVWSKRQATVDEFLRAALVEPRFAVLLDFAMVLGLEHVQKVWQTLEAQPDARILKAQKMVRRILSNIEKGLCRADATR